MWKKDGSLRMCIIISNFNYIVELYTNILELFVKSLHQPPNQSIVELFVESLHQPPSQLAKSWFT